MKPKILIVDDDNFVRAAYAAVFKNADFEVAEAIDGEEAYQKIQKKIPDIIFTGIIMPKLGGFELMEKLKKEEKYKNIPVVISSHRGKEEDRQKAYVLGASDFIVSGFVSPAEAVKKISTVVKKKNIYVLNLDKNSLDFEKFKSDFPDLFVDGKNPLIYLTAKDSGFGFDAEIK